jgi:hypothetical protein
MSQPACPTLRDSPHLSTSGSGRYVSRFAALHATFTRQDFYAKVGVMSAALWDKGLPASMSYIYTTPAKHASRDPITIASRTKIQPPVCS